MKTLPASLRIGAVNRRKSSYQAALVQEELRFLKDADPTIIESGPFRQMWEDSEVTLRMAPKHELIRALRWARQSFLD